MRVPKFGRWERNKVFLPEYLPMNSAYSRNDFPALRKIP